MQRLILPILIAIGAVLSPSVAHGQYAATQDSTLAGIKKVFVAFADVNQGLGANAAQLESSAILELRKAGIRVVRTLEELENEDAILNISFITTQRVLSTDLSLRMDLEQMAQLQRTKQTLKMVTWYHEQNALNTVTTEAAPKMLTKGVDDLISRWLDMNGR
jgi:hypothetical protein